MDTFDDDIEGRRFDNFQFVEWAAVSRYADPALSDDAFALAALQEVPAQHTAIVALRLLARAHH